MLYILYIYSMLDAPADGQVTAAQPADPKNERERMNLYIDNRSGVPIYDQIYTQIKTQIIAGSLSPDEALPSIRALAKDLRISVITTKRAYEELEREGFIYTVPAKGCFVSALETAFLREENLRKIEAHMKEIALLARQASVTDDELREMYEEIRND